MSIVIVKRDPDPKEHEKKKMLQACTIGGSLYGKVPQRNRPPVGINHDGNKDLASSYKNFYRNQVDMMSKVFGKNGKQG